MGHNEEKIRKELEELFDSVKTPEDVNNIRFLIDDYIEEGYDMDDYVAKYNLIAGKFN